MAITRDDVTTYGPELIDLARRAAREELEPQINQARQESHWAAQRAQAGTEQSVRDQLDRELPGWKAVNSSPQFLAFLSAEHTYSGRRRHDLLREAFSAGSATRVMAIFRDFLGGGQAGGQGRAPGRQAVDITSKDVAELYERIRRFGRTPETDEAEKWVSAAARAGQVRRVKA